MSRDRTLPDEVSSAAPAQRPDFRAAFVTLYDARDVNMMSGTGFNISQSFLDAGLDLSFIGPLKRHVRPANVARHVFNRYLLRKNDHPQRDPGFLRGYASQVAVALREIDVDVVFGSGGLPVAYLDTDKPLVIWTDCTFANLLNYYEKYTNLSRRTIRDGHAADRNLYQRCERAIFASAWAAESAIQDYGIPPERVAIVSRGANVRGGLGRSDIERRVDARSRERCILHFVGVDWRRKGGNVAVNAARELNRRGLSTELRVVGVEPECDGPTPDFVVPYGRISKASPEGMKRFTDLLSEAHFLIVPTRADAYGICYLEASAFGVPSLATRTGGVPSAVIDGVSGVLLDLADDGTGFADAVERLFNDPQAYRNMALGAFHDYQTRTNWPVVARQAIGVLASACKPSRQFIV